MPANGARPARRASRRKIDKRPGFTVAVGSDGSRKVWWKVATQAAPLRVLVVDDEPLICWSLAETLGDSGDIVTEAGTGAAAVRALSEASEPIDVVLLDYKLPDVQHLNLLSTVRRLSPSSRIILMSAYATPDIVGDALALGATRVLNKPIDMHDVSALVHEAARSRPN